MMYSDIVEIIKIGEGYTIEFKEKISDSIAKDICAFANSSGGKIILGVRDKTGEIVGFKLTNNIKSKIQNYARNLEPSLIVNLEQIKNLTVIYVPEGKEKPYFVNGRCYLRQGANSQQLSRDEIRNFFQKTNLIRFDRKLNHEFNLIEDFNDKAFSGFVENARIDKSLGIEHILKNLNLLEDGVLTNAGVLFFAKSIRKFFLNSVITAVLYQGYERIDILDRQDFEKDFITNLAGIIKFLLRNLRVKSIIKGLKRYDIPEFSEEVLREIVLNAMVHRDYFSEGRILIEIFKDRVEVSNPGGLLFEKELLGKKSITRNPLLADLVYRMGLVEKIGSGINKIRRVLGDNVIFEDEGDGFRVTLKRETIENVPENVPESRPDNIIRLMKNNPKITIKEISRILKVNEKTIKRDIKKLKEDRKIKRVGPDKGGYWEVVE